MLILTSEIGILNKNGVVLAADSAVTISNGINSKVFNSARKLFKYNKTILLVINQILVLNTVLIPSK